MVDEDLSGDATLAAPKSSATVAQELRLAVLMGPDAGAGLTVQTGKTATIGVLAENDLVLTDPLVSRVHLELSPSAEGAVLRDLGSLNGTYIGTVRVQTAVLPAGTRIRVGRTVLAVDLVGAEPPAPPSQAPAIPGLVFQSEAMAEVARAVGRLAKLRGAVLIEGETGTGKEAIATAIHHSGPRAEQPLVTVDCGSLPQSLLEAHLFGHEKGAFTGAERRRAGAFERAHRGTIFLDEIGELPLTAQPALLGVLERGRFRRVGGEEDVEVDVRVVSATNRDLRAEINRGAFRSDLYYRLAGTRLLVPALRDRPEDIPLLVSHFAQQLGSLDAAPFDEATLAELSRHYWRGNVRELRNAVETALALGRLSLEEQETEVEAGRSGWPTDGRLPDYKEARAQVLSEFERNYLQRLLADAGGNVSEAARRAKMDRPYLLTLLRKHGLR